MPTTMTPFLMFEGKAEEAMKFYISLFPGATIDELVPYGSQGPGKEGQVFKGALTVAGQRLRCFDSPVHHAFTFTPAISLFIECESEAEIERLDAALKEGGQKLMEIGNYGFSRQFA